MKLNNDMYEIAKACFLLRENSKVNLSKDIDYLFRRFIGQDAIDMLSRKTVGDRKNFIDIFLAFDVAREEYFREPKKTRDSLLDSHVEEIFREGFTKIGNFFSKECIEEANISLDTFSDGLEKLGIPPQSSGHILPTPEADGSVGQFRFEHHGPCEGDGQVRIQSKSWGGYSIAGAYELAYNARLNYIFAAFNSLNNSLIERSTAEWINPALINHNGWHRDMVTPQLKAMVLLEDTDKYSAPLLYAQRSHRATTEFDKQHLYDMFRFPPSAKFGLPSTWAKSKSGANIPWPDYATKVPEKHVGYMSPEFAQNDISPKDRIPSKINIGGSEYDMAVGTGKSGDVIFFDSCGLHSGTKSYEKRRRNVTFSSMKYCSLKHVFFNMVQKLV